MRKTTLVIAVFVSIAAITINASAQSNEEIAKAVMAMAKTQWAQENAKPGKAFKADIAEDYTEFNPNFPVRLDGKALTSAMYEAMQSGGGAGLVSDMANAKVQVYNRNIAILTYNYIGVNKDADGKTTPQLAKSTRVYVKIGKSWKLVHANFAPVTLPDN